MEHSDPPTSFEMPPPPPPVCMRQHCTRPTWNGKPGFYCSRGCRDAVDGVSVVPCVRPGCPGMSWNGRPGEYCSRSCRDSPALLESVESVQSVEHEYD